VKDLFAFFCSIIKTKGVLKMSIISWPSPDPFLEVLHVYEEKTSFQITMKSTHQSCPCPRCGVMSSRPHSRYTRIIQDLPIGEKSVSLLLISRKWFCDQATCDMNIFTERYDWLSINGRRTLRAEECLRKIAYSSSCLNGEKVAKAIHLPVSHDVLLSIIRKTDIKLDISPFCGY
jgi:hypothetical protein